MSKKPAVGSPPPSAAAGDVALPKLLCPAKVNLNEAMTRFSPFIFAVDTDTKDTVELKTAIATLLRDPAFTGSIFTVDRADAANFVAGLSDPSLGTLITDVKAQLPAILEGAGDSQVVAQCVRCRIAAYAIEREEARIDELEAAAARHAELVARLMEDGLTKSEAEKAALEEEAAENAAAAGGGGDGGDEEDQGPTRQQAFLLLRGFPNNVAEVHALANLGVPLDALLVVNSLARFGKREEVVAVDPKGKGPATAAKKADTKKPDPKKPGGKGGKGVEEGVVLPVESLSQMLAKERAKIAVFDTAHPLRHTVVWTYDVHTAESKSGAVDDATGLKIHDLLESEAEVAEKIINETVRLEQAVYEYRTWLATKFPRQVSKLPVLDHAHDANVDPIAQAAEEARKEAEAKAAAEAAAKEAAAKAAASKKPDAKKGGKAVVEEPPPAEVAPPPPAAPPLPTSMNQIPVVDELYRRLIDEVQPTNQSIEVRLHCMLEQVHDSIATASAAHSGSTGGAGGGATVGHSAASIAETIALKTKRDVADFCDYVLGQLDGSQEQLFEAARKRRLKAAEAAEPNAAATAEDEDKPVVPLADATYLRLMPHVQSAVEPDSLLLGVPLRRIEGRVKRPVHQAVTHSTHATTIRVDASTLHSFDLAASMFRHVLERMGATEAEISELLSQRTHALLHTNAAFADRLAELELVECDAKAYKAVCADGSHVLAVGTHVPAEKRKYRSTWEAFHGRIPLPQWLEWRDFVRAEELFFNPPPRDDDDIEDEPEAAPEDEEEDEEEEEIGVDEDGEPIMRKKPKKVVIYPPEYVHRDITVTDELRRRATLDHFKHRVAVGPKEELLLANNHTANVALSEATYMYPNDGSTIVVENMTANQSVVHTTVYTTTGVQFGNRCAVHPAPATTAEKTDHPTSPVPPLDVGAAANTTGSKTPKTSPRTQAPTAAAPAGAPGASAVTAPAGASATGDTAAAHSHIPTESAPQDVQAGISTVVTLRDDATIHITVTAQSTSDAGLKRGNSTPALDHAPEQSASKTILRCTLPGVTITFDPSGALQLVPEIPRDSPITAFNPLTRQVTRVSVDEVSRIILMDGTVMCRYSDGSRMNMFPNGNTAVYHEGHWLITNATGKRVLKDSNGKISPIVVSLVTTNTDTETLSRLTTREDGVVTVGYDDGKQLVQHIDGTRLWQDANRTTVEIESEGLPRIYARPGSEGGLSGCLTVKTVGDLTLTLVPGRRITVVHPASGFQGALDFATNLVHIEPSPMRQTRYVLDAAFGGLRVADGSFGFHVTPFGRTAARPLAEDQPVPVTQLPGVKQVIDIFMRPEIVNPVFAQLMMTKGWRVEESLHMLPTIPEFADMNADEMSRGGFSMPPRSRQQREKNASCVASLKAVVPGTDAKPLHAKSGLRDPLLFICGPHGALELLRKCDAEVLVGNATHRSNLLFTDVHVEPASIMHDDQVDGTSDIPAADTAGPLVSSIILSTAPPKLPTRTGVPKILVDLRRASAHSGPISVAQFLQDLKQGPLAKASVGSGDDAIQGGSIVVTSRHLVTLKPTIWSKGAQAGTEPTPLPNPGPGDACYERALMHLARAIPPIIAAQLALLPNQRSLGTTMRGRRTNTGGSRGRSSDKARSAQSKGAAAEDPEFAQQMAAIEQREKANRKPWPTPIPDKKKSIDATHNAAFGGFWSSPIGEPVIAAVKKENEKYTAKGGYQKVPVPMYATAPTPASISVAQAPAKPTATTTTEAKPSSEVAKPAAPQPPLQPTPPRQANGTSRTALGATKHVSPSASLLLTSLPGQPTASGLNLVRQPPQLTASPPSLHFGNVVAGYRYAVDVLLRNVGDTAARYRVLVEPASAAQHFTVSVPYLALAPGMATSATIELNGRQPVGSFAATITAVAEGGAVQVPIRVETSADTGRSSAGQPRPGVKILGPVPLQTFVPGNTKRAKPVAQRTGDSEED